MKKFEDEKFFVQFLERCDIRVAKGAIRSLSNFPEVIPRNLVFRDVKCKELDS